MAVVVFDKSIQLSDVERITKAQILHALKCVDANSSFQLVNDEGKQFCLMLPDSQIAICYKLKWNIQFNLVLHCVLENIPCSFKFDETTSQQAKKQYYIYTQYWREKHQCIKILYHGTLMVNQWKVIGAFLWVCQKSKFWFIPYVRHTGMDGPNVNFKHLTHYMPLLFYMRAKLTLNVLNSSICLQTCPLGITHNGFRSAITKLDFNVNSFVFDVNFF